MKNLIEEARGIIAETLQQVDVHRVVAQHIALDGEVLRLGKESVPIAELDQVIVIAVGKAALPMFEAARDALYGVPLRAVVVTNQTTDECRIEENTQLRDTTIRRTTEAHADPHRVGAMAAFRFVQDDVTFMQGCHPLPDAASLAATEVVQELLRWATNRTAVLFLISGGASAMLEAPLDPRFTLSDTAAFYQALIGSGMPIAQMNALRKHFSAVKGGRLAETAAMARMQYTMLISDVPTGMPDAIGSGPSLPDSSTLADCRGLLLGLTLPASVAEFFAGPLCVETPKVSDRCFQRAHWDVVLSSEHLAAAAAKAARAAGFRVEIDNECDEWEYRDAGRYLIDRGLEISGEPDRVCLISVGEVGVNLPPDTGEGGRNQQFALWCAAEVARRGVVATIASVGSDGIDGNSQMAGAVCDERTVKQAHELGLSVEDALAKFDAGPLLKQVGALIETGPTGNNLRDLRMLLFG